MNFHFLCAALALSLPVSFSHGLITYGGTNADNTTDPGTGVPWDAIAVITNGTLTSFKGSAIHLGGGYMMTADHNFNYTSVTNVSFNGTDVFTRDTNFAPTQVAAGVDMTIFKLTTVPTTSTVNRLDSPIETLSEVTMVAYGNGRLDDETLQSNVVQWGDSSTADKRWALNKISGAQGIVYTESTIEYAEVVLNTYVGSSVPLIGDDEGALARWDSGSALFQEISGTWYLVGMAVAISQATPGELSTFGDDTTGANADTNHFVRISTYNSAIDAVVPEPSLALIALPIAGLLFVGFSRRRK